MTDDMIERMVDAGKAAVWDLILSGDAKGAKAVTKTTRACLAAALRSLVSNKPTQLDGRGIILTGSALDAMVIVIEGLADRLEKGDG